MPIFKYYIADDAAKRLVIRDKITAPTPAEAAAAAIAACRASPDGQGRGRLRVRVEISDISHYERNDDPKPPEEAAAEPAENPAQ